MKKYLLIVTLLFIGNLINAQVIDNYGLRFGIGQSNQYIQYNRMEILSEWKDNKYGFNCQLNAEKYFNDYISIRPGIGYFQYGYNETIEWINGDPYGPVDPLLLSESSDFIVNIHFLSSDLVIKVTPLQGSIKPYLLLGIRGNFLVGYNDESIFKFGDEYKTLTLDGLIGIGISYNQILYFDFEYNPSLTKMYDNSFATIKNRYYSMTLGINVNKLLEI